MSEPLKRYTARIPGSGQPASMVPDPDGKFVRFADHEHEVANFARVIARLLEQTDSQVK